MALDIRSMVQAHDQTVAQREEAARMETERRTNEERVLVRLHAGSIQKCLEEVVEPVLEDAMRQLQGRFRVSLKKGRTNDKRLESIQTLAEIEIEVVTGKQYRNGAFPTYRLIYSGDVDRGTVTTMFALNPALYVPMGRNHVPVVDVSKDKVEADIAEFVGKMLESEEMPRPQGI